MYFFRPSRTFARNCLTLFNETENDRPSGPDHYPHISLLPSEDQFDINESETLHNETETSENGRMFSFFCEISFSDDEIFVFRGCFARYLEN